MKKLKDLQSRLTYCYRHLRWTRPALEGTVSVEIAVDPFGTLRDPKVTAHPPDAAPLVPCVERALASLRYPSVTPRETRLLFSVRFTPSGQRRPKTEPPNPDGPLRKGIPAARPVLLPCLLAFSPLPVDRPSLPTPVLTVTDFDPMQACLDNAWDEASKRRAVCQKRYGPRAPCQQRVTTFQCRGHHIGVARVFSRPSTLELEKDAPRA